MKAQIQNSLFMVSEIKVSYQPKFKACERPKVTQSKDAYNILFHNWDQGRIEMNEQFFILLLNRANNVMGMAEISSGGFSGTLVDPKLVFGIALKSCASSIILCHNHPSGNLKPSEADLTMTKRLVEAGKLLDLMILDHIILTKRDYFSFGDEGLL
ncbi:DNA repair protein radc [Pedobacter westerhofensis]|uniref:DNA repair protein radc n=2 Tax=Pedobacter westerhofensis TaxID=425512 RepID=A0A521DNG1_9SPHI|nr:DNA repair protein radc [Pedobacter westerhofensis]